jgi:hypothetical protein
VVGNERRPRTTWQFTSSVPCRLSRTSSRPKTCGGSGPPWSSNGVPIPCSESSRHAKHGLGGAERRRVRRRRVRNCGLLREEVLHAREYPNTVRRMSPRGYRVEILDGAGRCGRTWRAAVPAAPSARAFRLVVLSLLRDGRPRTALRGPAARIAERGRTAGDDRLPHGGIFPQEDCS